MSGPEKLLIDSDDETFDNIKSFEDSEAETVIEHKDDDDLSVNIETELDHLSIIEIKSLVITLFKDMEEYKTKYEKTNEELETHKKELEQVKKLNEALMTREPIFIYEYCDHCKPK